jgi:hypothetical protein
MHYAGLIAGGQIDPRSVPKFPGPTPQERSVGAYRGPDTVDICWAHTDQAGNYLAVESINAAKQMLAAYGLAHPAAYPSKHSLGKAIDMNISWTGTLRLLDANGNPVHVHGQPRDGMNPQLWPVGAGFGVIKLVTDPPHWSDDGH